MYKEKVEAKIVNEYLDNDEEFRDIVMSTAQPDGYIYWNRLNYERMYYLWEHYSELRLHDLMWAFRKSMERNGITPGKERVPYNEKIDYMNLINAVTSNVFEDSHDMRQLGMDHEAYLLEDAAGYFSSTGHLSCVSDLFRIE